MDLKVENGDVAMNANGDTVYIGQLDEAVQRVRFVALTQRGAFIYDRGLGVDYNALEEDEPDPVGKLDMLLKEAAAGIGGVETQVLTYDADSGIMRVRVTCHGRDAVTEVDVSGNL